MRLLIIALFAALLALSYGLYFKMPEQPTLPGVLESGTLSWEGRERSYLFYLPSKLSAEPALVFAFHGSGGDAQQSRSVYGYSFEQLAEEEGFIVVYPEGYDAHYNGCRKTGPYEANRLQVDDVGYMGALVDRFADQYGVNRAVVFATGVSNGGQMALRLALEAPELVAAVAPVATSLPTDDNMDCVYSGIPVAFLLMNGTDDPMNPYDGGTVALYGLLGDRGEVISSRETVQYWADLAGYSGQPQDTQLPDKVTGDNSTVTVTRWAAADKPPVALYRVEGGGHNAPHPAIQVPRILGDTNNDINAAREIWSFFQTATP
jgi:polyhydroxybutyrate depolymerase